MPPEAENTIESSNFDFNDAVGGDDNRFLGFIKTEKEHRQLYKNAR
jgi:hypothetical protein